MASQMTIQVDSATADLIHRAEAIAQAHGQTLASYLRHVLPSEVVRTNGNRGPTQAQAWNTFVSRMTALVDATVPRGHVADDSRSTMYEDDA